MEGMVNSDFWKGKRVLITGHTGFKGSWLSYWLQLLDAKVIGYALPPPTNPSLFALARVEEGMTSIMGDIRELPFLQKVIESERPEIIFHLAAQALVRRSYQEPLETYSTNIMGTVQLLEAIRMVGGVRAVVIITSDKCYENKEWVWGYRESDSLGGSDPYSSSKGCAELITAAYRKSFFNPAEFDQHGVALASVRAGNVIGGGDWGEDRLVPDVIKAYLQNQAVQIRSPRAYRPWQHVLEPLRGYLLLAARLYTNSPMYAEPWNFGPAENDVRPVIWLVEHLTKLWGIGAAWALDPRAHPHEAHLLKLDCSKSKALLGWKPKLNLEQALDWTVSWYKTFRDDPSLLKELTKSQIISYQNCENE
jgi:CDP-glucose 4,6-dehydratase